jgi:hypothetical protein
MDVVYHDVSLPLNFHYAAQSHRYFSSNIPSEPVFKNGLPEAPDAPMFNSRNGRSLQYYLKDKHSYLVGLWNEEHPNHRVRGFDHLLKLVENSHIISKWYSKSIKHFGYLHEQPEWVLLDSTLRTKWLQDSALVFEQHKLKRKSIIDRRALLLKTISEDLKALDEEESQLVNKFYKDHPLVAINKIPVQGLPQDVVLKHHDKSGEALEKALEHELSNYKLELGIKYHNKGSKEIEELIKLLGELL